MGEIRKKMQTALLLVLCAVMIVAGNAADGYVEMWMSRGRAEATTVLPTLPPIETATPAQAQRVKLDLNTADAWMLTAIPGVGETLAARVIAYREKHGAFVDVRELERVEGIGEALCEEMMRYVKVELDD